MSRSGRQTHTGGFKVEFTAGYLNFIPQLTVLLLSCLLPVLAICGKNVLGTLLVGIIATYIFDYTNCRQLALTSVWCCVGAVWFGLYFSNVALLLTSWLNVFILLNSTFYLLIIGLFATIQFKWLQMQAPELALVIERLLFGLSPIVCLPLIFATILTFFGSQIAAFVMAVVMCVLHRFFYTLHSSSFKQALSPDAAPENYINGRLEAAVFTTGLVAMPMLLQAVIHYKEPISALYLLNLLTLLAVPILYLFFDTRKSLWFLHLNPFSEDPKPSDDILNLSLMRSVMLLSAYLLVLHWLVYRVVFGRFAHLFTKITPPFNIVLVCVAAYAGSIVVYSGIRLVESDNLSHYQRAGRWCGVLFCSIVAAATFTTAVGMPRFMVCCSALAASCLTSYCLEPKNVNNFLIFAATTFIMLTAWMYQSFSFLQVNLTILGGTQTISLSQLSVYVLWLYLLQCFIFPMGMTTGRDSFFVGLLLQVLALAAVEHILYSQPENLYPSYCVFGTSFWGIYFTYTLLKNKKLSKGQAAINCGLYVAKAYLFIMCVTLPDPESELYVHAFSRYTLEVSMFLVACMAGIVIQLYFEKLEKKRRANVRVLAMGYLFCALCIALLSRNSVVTALLELMTEDSEVKIGRLYGLVSIYAGVLCLPLTSLLPPAEGRLKRITAGLIVIGSVIAVIDPVFENPEASSNLEMDIYEPPSWSLYLGVTALLASCATLLNIITMPDSVAIRFSWWTVVSIACGCSFTGMFIPYASWHTHLLTSLIFGLTILCIDLIHFSVSAQKEESNSVWGLYTGALVSLLASLFDAQWRVPADFDPNLQFETTMQRQGAILSLSIGINLLLAGLVKLKLVERPVLRPRNVTRVDDMRNNIGGGTHFGLLGNIAVVQGYVSLLVLRNDLGSGSPTLPVIMAPLFLLMSDDGWLFEGLNDPEQLTRYVPPMVASIITLVWQVAWVELPGLIKRSPMSFAVQLTILMLTLAIAVAVIYELWIDSKVRRQQGSTDIAIIITTSILFILAGTECMRLAIGVVLIGCMLPFFNDSVWAAKWASKI
eukprot:TRINITY_DN9891_c2_g1_i1.p1 TRINITY_DN9891_c2_g1~~TRINITY_DN9891_c2_g1_i1.p1  ORF type:complete len:1149 (+),score=157.60 TRINITY_DN9891_c2_g1_i1:302-3448(+)